MGDFRHTYLNKSIFGCIYNRRRVCGQVNFYMSVGSGRTIYTLGIGQPNPTSIRLADGTYLESEGKMVETALNPEPLQLISRYSADGFYQNLATTPTWLQNITKVIESKEFSRRNESQQQRKTPRYAPLLLLAMLFLALSVIIPDRTPSKRRHQEVAS